MEDLKIDFSRDFEDQCKQVWAMAYREGLKKADPTCWRWSKTFADQAVEDFRAKFDKETIEKNRIKMENEAKIVAQRQKKMWGLI